MIEQSELDRAKIFRYVALLEQMGLNLPRPYTDHVRGKFTI